MRHWISVRLFPPLYHPFRGQFVRTVSAVTLLALNSCASGPDPLPQDGPTTLQIYQRHLAGELPGQSSTSETTARPVWSGGEFIALPTRGPSRRTQQALQDLQRDFQRVPNPELLGYVYPHLNGEMPVPGYFTAFPLYERDHYAEPGEGLLLRAQP